MSIDTLSDDEFLQQPAPPEPQEEAPSESQGEAQGEAPSDPIADEIVFPEDYDYKAAYLALRKPFKANGKEVVIKDDAELIRLAQMGVGYTAKSMKLAAQARLAGMLEKGGISEEDLPLLIDLKHKKPEAIQKYFKEANIDPLDVDIAAEPTYVQGNYSVSDKELAFKNVLDELAASDSGKEFIGVVHRNWDSVSKESLWEDSNILPVLAEQYASGVYARITQEMDRLKLVGSLPNNVPFLQAYKAVGEHMLAQMSPPTNNQVAQVRQPIARGVVTPKTPFTNDQRAQAATPSRSTSNSVGRIDYTTLTDEEFLKVAPPNLRI